MPKYLNEGKFNPRSIKVFRKVFNLTQLQLAQILNCAPHTVSAWEQDQGRPSGYFINKMVHICVKEGIGIPHFFEED